MRRTVTQLLGDLRRLAPQANGDDDLLRRFIAQRDEAAFEELLRRHGPMVRGVCRRVLGDGPDADDAFQAVFLVLSRRAASIRRREALSGWLHGVARRLAVHASRRARRRGRRERQEQDGVVADAPDASALDPAEALARRELRPLLDAELGRLPERYRLALIMCHIQGLSSAAAAEQIGCPRGTLLSHLARGRELLRRRLVQRGAVLSAALLTAELREAKALVPAPLARTTLACASRFARERVLGAPAVLLANQLLKTVALRQWRLVAALVLLGCSLLGVGYGVSRPAAEEKAGEEPAAATIDEPGKPTPRRDRAGDPLPMGAAARLGTTRLRHTDLISALAFSPDGKTIFAAGRDAIRLWDAETGEERGNFGAAAKDPDTRMTVSPDGKFLALSSFDGVSWWDVPGRKLLHAVPHEGGALDFAADGATLRSGTKTWAVPTGKEQGAAPPPRMETQCVARSADGKRTAWLKAHEGTVYLCNGAKNEVSVRFHCDRASLAVFDPIGKTVAVGGCFIGVRGSVALFDADSGKEIRRFPGTWDAVQSLSISTDGRWLAASSGGVYVLVWEVATGELRHAFRVPPGSGNHPDIGLHSTAFSPDGKSLIAAGEGQTIHVWDLNTGKPKFPSEGHEGLVRAAFFSPNGKLLTTLGDDSRVHVWDVARSAETLVTPLPDFGLHNWTMFGSKYMPVGIFRAGAYAPDGRTIATADDNGWIRIWDAATGRELRHLDGCVVWPRALALSPDGQLLAAGGNGRTTSVWNVDTGRIVRTIESKLGENPLLFSRAEKGLIVGCRLWNVETGREIRRFGTDDELAIQAQSPDGRLLAAYDSQGALRLFDARSGAELPCTIDARRPLNKSGFDYVSPPSFSPDGRLLAYPEEGASSAIVLHEVSTGVERGRFTVEGRGVKIVGFLPDGRLLAAIGPDTSILLFDLTGRAGDGPPKTSALQPRELEARWQALASDGPKAHRAIWDLTSAPESVEFLDKLLVFEEPAAGESFQTLLAELDSPDFERREQAVRRLEQLGDRAEGGLRAALGAGPSLERRQRIESLLRDLAQSPQRLRSRRALEVLEHVGSPESRAVLRRLAEGSETLFVQREARAALVRLESDRR